jgi:hypothetical protein
MRMALLGLETSSYLPLVWNTPYTRGIWTLIQDHGDGSGVTGVIHRDSIKEASGYFSATNAENSASKQWMYDPAFRARCLAESLSESELSCLPFPSTAFAIILGGSIWPFGQYLNYSRHCGFLYCDLADAIDFRQPKKQLLLRLADMIVERSRELSQVFDCHLAAQRVTLSAPSKYPYWGRIYDGPANASIELRIRDDLPWDKHVAPTRDAYHYLMMRLEAPRPDLMIVADGGYDKNVRRADLPLDLELLTATSWKPVCASPARRTARRTKRCT